MKCTRQRCQVAPSTLTMAAFRPSCASEITSFAPRKPRRARLRRELDPEGLGFAVADGHAKHLAPPVVVDADGDDHRDRDDVVVASGFDVGGIEPEIGPLTLDRATEECLHPLVDLAA